MRIVFENPRMSFDYIQKSRVRVDQKGKPRKLVRRTIVKGCRHRVCSVEECNFIQSCVYGELMGTSQHVCIRNGEKVLVIWGIG